MIHIILELENTIIREIVGNLFQENFNIRMDTKRGLFVKYGFSYITGITGILIINKKIEIDGNCVCF